MKFSTKSRYALRLMAELARYAPGTTVSLKEISERQNLSLKYLEQIVTPLAGQERAGQSGRLPADERPRRLHRRRDPARHRGQRSAHSVPWQRDQRMPYVRAVLHPAVLGGAGRGDQPVYRQRYAGTAGKPTACAGFRRAGELLQLRRREK